MVLVTDHPTDGVDEQTVVVVTGASSGSIGVVGVTFFSVVASWTERA